MGKKGFFATLLLIITLIFLLFPSSTGKEHILVPEKIVDLENTSHAISNNETGTVSFSLDDYFGFFTDNLELTYVDKTDYRVAISDNSFINYPKIPKILNIQNMEGKGQSIIENTGYPILKNDRIVLLSDSFISLYDLNGNLYWKKEVLSIITSLSISRDFVLVGYLDGLCELISTSGNVELTYKPGGSRIEAIYSVALSGDGEYITLISGLDPQRFILLQNRKGEYKPIFHFELNDEFRRSINMYFSSDDTKVFFESSQGVNIFDIALEDLSFVGDSGRLEKIYKDNERDLYSVLLSQQGKGYLKILTPGNLSVLEKEFVGNSLFFKKRGDRYYIGSDNLLMYFKLVNQ